MARPQTPILTEIEIVELERDLLENHRQHILYLIEDFRCACQDLRVAARNADAKQAHEASQNVIWAKQQLDRLETYREHTSWPKKTVEPRVIAEEKKTP